MNTVQFINQFQNANCISESLTFLEKAAEFASRHPTVVKGVEIAGMIFGGASLLLTPTVYKTSKLAAVTVALMGTLTLLISAVAYKVLDLVLTPHHSMESHVFTPGVFESGRLYYQGHVPVLELQSDDPYKAGLAHGYLLGAPLNDLLGRLTFANKLAEMAGMPFMSQADQAFGTIQEIRSKLLPAHLRELEGIVAGFNQWSQEHQWFKHTVSVDDLILFHLMPDSLHFSPRSFEAKRQRKPILPENDLIPPLGCTVVIDQDKDEGMTFGRNMDWPSFGVFGRYSLVINRQYSDQRNTTAEIGVPGFVGTLTGMNEHGLSLAMNVCSGRTDAIRGVPAAFFNRMCLETCLSVKEVEDKIEKEAPLGSYHLSIADSRSAKSFHFYQGDDATPHVVREWKDGKPLITTNCKYTLDDRTIAHMHCSLEREQIIQKLFKEAEAEIQSEILEKAKLVEASLSLPDVNTSITTHTVVMYPQALKMKAAFDNTFSASATMHEIDLQPLFE